MVKVLQREGTRGTNTEHLRRLFADVGESVEPERHTEAPGDRHQVDELVRRSSGGRLHPNGVVEGILRHPVVWANVGTGELHRAHTGALAQIAPPGFDCRDCR